MKVRYENLEDILVMQLRPGTAIADVWKDFRGRLFYYGADGELVTMEIADASLQFEFLRSLERCLDAFVDDWLRRDGKREMTEEGGMPT